MQSMNTISARLALFKRKALCLAFAAAFAPSVLANPLGPQVASGSATFATSGNKLTVTNTPGTIINWQQFNIGAGETTRFNQQSAQSSVMNRIGGQDASQILGTLSSNGRVFLVNPNGVMFGQGAVVDVAGLVASSLNLSDANFLANKLNFSGGGFGAVTNLGSISTPLGGSVYLIGASVSNQGLITSPQGRVLLAAGNSVSLIDSAGPELSVTLVANGNQAVNLGTINAAGGRIDMFGALIEQAGVLRADSATVDAAGNITLKATQSTTLSGEISATNSLGSGGKVRLLGDQVTLTPTAKIDVSGVGAGGTALIGGDYQGNNAAVQNANLTTIAAGATIKADALGKGNGGRVIVWSDDKAIFDGFISARGGANGGDGGFVETSGKNALSVSGGVNTLAPKGKTGEWLLDPGSYCLEDSPGFSCSGALYSTAGSLVRNAAAIVSGNCSDIVCGGLNTTDITLQATDFIDIYTLNLASAGLTRDGATLKLEAPTIHQFGSITGSNSFRRMNLMMKAEGTSATFASDSGKIIQSGGAPTDIILGTTTFNGELIMQASKEIEFLTASPTSISMGSGAGGGSGLIFLSAPKIVTTDATFFDSPQGALVVETNRVSHNTPADRFVGQVSSTLIKPYTNGFPIYLGKSNSDPICGTSALCLTMQFAGPSAGFFPSLQSKNSMLLGVGTNTSELQNQASQLESLAEAALKETLLNYVSSDIFVSGYGSNWNIGSSEGLALVGNNLTLNSTSSSISGSGWVSSPNDYPLILAAKGTVTNNGQGITNMPVGKGWVMAVGNLPGSSLGSLSTGAKTLTVAEALTVDSETITPGTNVIIDLNLTTSAGLCSLNPTACQVPENPLKDLNDQSANNFLTPYDSTAKGSVTFAADLKLATGEVVKKDEVSRVVGDSGAKGVLTTSAAAAVAKSDEKKKAEVARERREARAVEERKSPVELKREAQQARGEAKKLEGDAKKVEAEGKRAEAEARKAEVEHKKAAAQHKKADVEAKKAEEGGKKAEVEAKQHDGAAKQAAAEAKSAKSADGKATAEARKAEAESKKADAESRKTDAESKKAVAETKKVEAEHKQADAEAKRGEADHKRVEAEAKHVEAESKKAEAEHKIALAEVKEARTPQQKAAAEKRADDKRIEAIQKKAEANVKKEQAEVKKAEVEAKQAATEHKKTEAEAKKSEVEAKHAEGDSKRAESHAKKAEAEGKRAEADAVKAGQAGKGGEQKKAEVKKAEAEKKAVIEEKRAESKKAEAEKKHAEANGKKNEAERKRGQAEQKKVAAEKKQTEHRERAAKSFAKAAVAAMSPEKLAEVIALRHEHKTEAMKPALSILARNPAAANLPACGGGSDICIPSQQAAQQVAQQLAQLAAPRVPTLSFLPQIQRKIAVVVAINNYKDSAIPALESAVPDGEAVGKLMQDKLGYDVRVIRDAGRADIVKSLNAVAREVGPNDSVTVYYAGHGYQMPDKSGRLGEGYWIPADGSAKEPSNWISNSDVSKLLANIPARQVMLVSDSCYSGAFTKEQKVAVPAAADPSQILAKRSVVVMSSGGEEPVSDEGKEGHSIFAWSLMNALKNVDKFDSGGKLYDGIRKQVIEEFPQVPQYGASTSAGHVPGGDYLFETRRY